MIRPYSINVTILGNDEEILTVTIIVNDDDTQNYTLNNLPVYDDDWKEINYSAKEDATWGYETSYSYETDNDGNIEIAITNTYTSSGSQL